MARSKKSLKIKPVLFIACEGTSSEYQYFESWSETDEARDVFEKINVYPDQKESSPKTTPFELFEIAKKVLDDKSADYIWIVFDKDNHPKLPLTFEKAKESGVRIAFSSRSFEDWVLMHFEKNLTTFNASECKDNNDKPINCGSVLVPNCNPINCLSGYIRGQNFIPTYSKKKDFDLFNTIRNRTEIAIVNAAWLRFNKNSSLNKEQTNIWSINPYTDVDQLIFQLHKRSDKLEWGNSRNITSLNNWNIRAYRQGINIILEISHTLPQPCVLNNIFEQNSFFTTDDMLENSECSVVSKILIQSANGSSLPVLRQRDIVEYTLLADLKPYFLFIHNQTMTKIFIEL